MLNQVYKIYSFRGGGDFNEKNPLIVYTFNILAHLFFLSFSWQFILLKNVDMYTFRGGGEKVHFCPLI